MAFPRPIRYGNPSAIGTASLYDAGVFGCPMPRLWNDNLVGAHDGWQFRRSIPDQRCWIVALLAVYRLRPHHGIGCRCRQTHSRWLGFQIRTFRISSRHDDCIDRVGTPTPRQVVVDSTSSDVPSTVDLENPPCERDAPVGSNKFVGTSSSHEVMYSLQATSIHWQTI